MEEVVLHGNWVSPFSRRVEWAFKLKGIPYKFVEEDFINKSPELLQYNPVHKKIPVLVHNGKPIVESLVILEYIEETWKDTPLLPQDPYIRSRIRFWSHFYDNIFSASTRTVLFSEGEVQMKAMKEMIEHSRVLMEGLEKDFDNGAGPFFHGEWPGFLDIVIGSSFCTYEVFEEMAGEGVKIIDPEKNSTFFKWICAVKEHPLLKQSIPPYDKLFAGLKAVRQSRIYAPKA